VGMVAPVAMIVVSRTMVVTMIVVSTTMVVVVLVIGRGPRAARPGHDEAPAHVAAAAAALEARAQAAHADGAHGVSDDLRGHARVDEGGNRHVARDARGGLEVEVQALEGAPSLHVSRLRLSMAASWPAPKPLSMLTTETPAAQDVSIASRAAMPSRLAP